MSPAISIGRIAGFPIRLRLSFLFLLGLVFFTMGGLGGVFGVLLTFGSVLLHELGHALVARRLGVRIAAIDLHFLGGAAQMIDPPRTARDEITIAAAGPLVSLSLAGLGFGLGTVMHGGVLLTLGWINLVLGLFNLIPALPMDGGRILRAALAGRLGYRKATEVAVKISRGFAIAFAVAGLALAELQLVLLAVLLWSMGTAERSRAWATAYEDEVVVEPADPYDRHDRNDRYDRNDRPPRIFVVRW
jgi:Zn-dependent protease